MLITDIAFIKANLIMRKILDGLTILSTILTLGIVGTGFYLYQFVRSPQFEKMMMDKVTKKIEGLLPKALDKGLPKVTGPSIPKL